MKNCNVSGNEDNECSYGDIDKGRRALAIVTKGLIESFYIIVQQIPSFEVSRRRNDELQHACMIM